MRHPDHELRGDAVLALYEHTELAQVQQALRSALHDEDGNVRMLAAWALARSALFGEEVIPVLVAMLEVGDRATPARMAGSKLGRQIAASVVGTYGAKAAMAVPALKHALLDPEAEVRRNAARSLGNIGPAALGASPALHAAKQSEEDEGQRLVYESAIRKIVQSGIF